MSNNFDWQTDDNLDWDRLEEAPPPEPPGWRRHLIPLLVGLLLLAGAVAYGLRLAGQRIDENTTAMRRDVVSSHDLLQIAEEEQDEELFFSLLSGRDSSWTEAQHNLFKGEALFDRATFGLKSMPVLPLSAAEEDSYSLIFSPDLQTAEVRTYRPYEIKIGNNLTETVSLQNTSHFRLGRERWLLSPPDAEFWGPESSQSGARLRMTYPLKDEEIAGRLLEDLGLKLGEVCSMLADIECPPDLQIDIQLSTDPESLLRASRPYAAGTTGEGLRLSLPTPTLIGLPQDTAAYQALYRGYASQMAAALIARQVGYTCCQRLPIFQALLNKQLSQLSLHPWPVKEGDFEQVLDEQVRLENYFSLWQSETNEELNGPDGWRIYALIDYLLSSLPQSTPAGLQRELVTSGTFLTWLNNLFEGQNEASNSALLNILTRGFWARGYSEMLDVVDNLEGGPTEQVLYLTCVVDPTGEEIQQVATIFRYDTQDRSFSALYDTDRYLWISPLPGDEILLQQEFGYDEQRWTTIVRQHDQLVSVLPDSSSYTVSFAQTDPLGNGLAAFVFPPRNDEATITWFDLLRCSQESGCDHRELPGIPIWSPDGERALFTDDADRQIDLLQTELRTVLFDRQASNIMTTLYVADRADFLEGEPLTDVESLESIGRGHAPFWIDDGTIGYISGVGEPVTRHSTSVVTASTADFTPQTLFDLDDLAAYIGLEANEGGLAWIHYAMVNPQNPEELFVVVLSGFDQRAHVLSYDRTSGDVRMLMSAGYLANHSLAVSPDGRYLVLTGLEEEAGAFDGSGALLQVYDLERQEVIPFLSVVADFPPFSTYDWSRDGKWLAFLLDDNMLGLFSPGLQQLQMVNLPSGQCGSPAWMNRS